MFQGASRVRLPDPGEHRWAGLAAGLVALAILVAIDAAAGSSVVIVTAYLIGAFTAALIGTPRETAIVFTIAMVLAIASSAWNENFGEVDYFVRLLIVLIGGGLALVAAFGR